MQRSDDITINSTASVKRRGKGPIVVRKTYCSLLDPSLEEHTASSLCVSSSKVFFLSYFKILSFNRFKYDDTKLKRTQGKYRKVDVENQRKDFL
ncbi:hypothetical protein YC2023_010843 [Brassica napus]